MLANTALVAVPKMMLCSHGCSVQDFEEAQATEDGIEMEAMPGESLVMAGVEEPGSHYDWSGNRRQSPAWGGHKANVSGARPWLHHAESEIMWCNLSADSHRHGILRG